MDMVRVLWRFYPDDRDLNLYNGVPNKEMDSVLEELVYL